MKDLKIDETGDIIINSDYGDVELVEGNDEQVQAVHELVNTFMGELDWNTDIGLNQMQLLTASDTNAVQSILNEYLVENLPGYSRMQLNRSNYNRNSRELDIDVTIYMDDGAEINIGGDSNAD